MCTEYSIIQKDQAPICPVDASGCFTSEVTDFAGEYVKVSDTMTSTCILGVGRYSPIFHPPFLILNTHHFLCDLKITEFKLISFLVF